MPMLHGRRVRRHSRHAAVAGRLRAEMQKNFARQKDGITDYKRLYSLLMRIYSPACWDIVGAARLGQ